MLQLPNWTGLHLNRHLYGTGFYFILHKSFAQHGKMPSNNLFLLFERVKYRGKEPDLKHTFIYQFNWHRLNFFQKKCVLWLLSWSVRVLKGRGQPGWPHQTCCFRPGSDQITRVVARFGQRTNASESVRVGSRLQYPLRMACWERYHKISSLETPQIGDLVGFERFYSFTRTCTENMASNWDCLLFAQTWSQTRPAGDWQDFAFIWEFTAHTLTAVHFALPTMAYCFLLIDIFLWLIYWGVI